MDLSETSLWTYGKPVCGHGKPVGGHIGNWFVDLCVTASMMGTGLKVN